ncbi:MAG: aminotransferase class IV [Chitinophagales bacterium]|nr:aminotransferase class IV [Chitinophagaceae bacterium]MCB9065293.1 aminotransferase class IV [Chitinophagales bacterium]
MIYININGRFFKSTSAAVPYNNRSFRFGFGLFETMLVLDEQIQLKELHWERLFAGIKQLNLALPELMTKDWIEEEILRTVKKNKLQKQARVRFQIYAGRGGLFDGQYPWAEFVIECQPVETHIMQLNEKGLDMDYTEGIRKSADDIANLKSSNAMVYAVAARQAIAKNIDNCIIVNTDDNAIETTIANIFCIKDDKIYTPPLSEGCVAGVMRKHVLQQLGQNGFTVEERPFDRPFLKNADSVFATNAIRRVKWISNIGETEYKLDKIFEVYENISF